MYNVAICLIVICLQAKVSTKSNKAKFARASTQIMAKTIRDQFPKVPNYELVTFSNRNHLIADDELLRYMPYVGDDDSGTTKKSSNKRFMEELKAAYRTDRSLPSEVSERANGIREYLDGWLNSRNIGCDERDIQRYLIQYQGHELKKTERVLKMLLKSLGGPLESDTEKRVQMFDVAFQKVFEQDLMDVVLPEAHLREYVLRLLYLEPGSSCCTLLKCGLVE